MSIFYKGVYTIDISNEAYIQAISKYNKTVSITEIKPSSNSIISSKNVSVRSCTLANRYMQIINPQGNDCEFSCVCHDKRKWQNHQYLFNKYRFIEFVFSHISNFVL